MPKIKVNINPFEMKLCINHYNHKSIPDAKFEVDSRGNKSSNSTFYPRKTGLTLKKSYVQNCISRPKIDPPPLMSILSISSRGNFFIFKIFGKSQ